MNNSTNQFFANKSNYALLSRFLNELRSLPEKSNHRGSIEYYLCEILQLIVSNADQFDEYCTSNIEWIGQSFLDEINEYLKSKSETRPEIIKSIFPSAFRFLCELEFSQPNEPSFEVRRITSFVHENIGLFEGTNRQQLIYAAYTMPAQIARKLISHPSISDFRKFLETADAAKKLREEWDEDLNKRQSLLEGLANNIKKTASEYNFVGLVKGFQTLRSLKSTELKTAFNTLWILGVAMLVVPLAQVLFVMIHLDEIDKHKVTLAYSLPTILTIEIVLLYFFRVVLGQFKSVKAQLLQLDLRISLCQFIESYAEYVSTLRGKDANALEKFESLIFSGLVAVETGIPSTFDGIDQIATLIKTLRGDSKN
jgi:hypothetical protein